MDSLLGSSYAGNIVAADGCHSCVPRQIILQLAAKTTLYAEFHPPFVIAMRMFHSGVVSVTEFPSAVNTQGGKRTACPLEQNASPFTGRPPFCDARDVTAPCSARVGFVDRRGAENRMPDRLHTRPRSRGRLLLPKLRCRRLLSGRLLVIRAQRLSD